MVTWLDKFLDDYIPNKSAWYAYLHGLAFVVSITVITGISNIFGASDSLNLIVFGVKVNISALSLAMFGIIWIDANLFVRRYQKGESNYSYAYTAVVLSVMVLVATITHEMGHAIVSLAFSNPISEAGISWWGAFVTPSHNILTVHPVEQIAIAAAGPFTNYLLFVIAAAYVAKHDESLKENSAQYFAWVNYLLFMYNMLPVITNTDGGKILHGILRIVGVGENWLTRITFVIGIVLCLFYYIYRIATGEKSTRTELSKL